MDRSTMLDAARYQYLVRNPGGAQHLLRLLETGKGNSDSLDKMIDRLIASEMHIREGSRS